MENNQANNNVSEARIRAKYDAVTPEDDGERPRDRGTNPTKDFIKTMERAGLFKPEKKR